jgi:ribonuclease HII
VATQSFIPDNLARELEAHEFVCGSDEVGYGAWAGPLCVCAAITFPSAQRVISVTDSKRLSVAQREDLYHVLSKTITHSIVCVEPEEIDQRGLGVVWEAAHSQAIQKAIDAHKAKGHKEMPLVIVDGNRGFLGATALPKADLLIPAVSIASILAKVHRDHIMYEMDTKYPGYGFKSHVGYGVPQHQEALERLGITPIHRKSYAPIAKLIRSKTPDMMDLLADLEQDA